MKSKPIVMNHFSTVHTSYIVNFDFTNNITILTGSSGTGKTASFSFMKECMAVNPDIVCINYQDYQKDIKKLVSSESGKLIVIDNADILLDDDTRKYISTDDKNQYLIIGRNPKNLFTTSDNLFELISEKKGEQTEFRLKKYLSVVQNSRDVAILQKYLFRQFIYWNCSVIQRQPLSAIGKIPVTMRSFALLYNHPLYSSGMKIYNVASEKNLEIFR